MNVSCLSERKNEKYMYLSPATSQSVSGSEDDTKLNDKTAPINTSEDFSDEVEDHVEDNLEIFKSQKLSKTFADKRRQ